MLKLILSALLLCGGLAQAQAQSRDARLQNLERKVQQLQRQTMNLEDRLRNLEYGQFPPNNGPLPAIPYSAILIDTGYTKTFLGSGNTKLEAEANVRQICAKSVHPSYCNGNVRFGQASLGEKASFCMITDTGYSKTFTGRGDNLIEAEAKAKQACQESVHPSYCGNTTARCETEK